MASSSSSKVAALANIFQQDQGTGGKDGLQGGAGDSKPEGSLKIFKSSINLKRTSSQVARFSSAKKIFEMKDKSLNKSHSDPPVSGPVSVPDLANTLPHRLCSPRRSGSRIPIGDFWLDKRDKKNSDEADKIVEAKNKINQAKSSRFNKENVPDSVSNKKSPIPKAQHIKKYDDLANDVKSPVLHKAESQFSGLLESILSPEYKKAELDFDKIAEENISSDNILDFVDKSIDDVEGSQIPPAKEVCQVEGVVEITNHDQELETIASKKDVTMEQDCSTNEGAAKGKRLQSTPKDSKTKSQERNTCDLSRTRESFNGFETTSEVTLDKTNNNSGNLESQISDTCESRAANASSLGSSLTGQSVSSWLGTTSATNTTNEGGLKTDTEADNSRDERADNSDKNVTVSQEKTESSDYVSGDSCDIISPPPALPTTDSPALNTTRTISEHEEVKVHFLEDGHYWYEGSPLAAISREDEFEEIKPKNSKVRFSTSPIRHFSTFSNDDYDRRNDEVDPALATAEYEQEKRMAMMESMTVELDKTSEGGLGVSVLGVTMGPSLGDGEDKLSIFVKVVTPDGPADREGTLKVGDQIISVDGVSLVGVTQDEAGAILRSSKEKVSLVIARYIHKTPDQVLQYIQECTDSEADCNQATESNESSSSEKKFEDNTKSTNENETGMKEPPAENMEEDNDNDKSILNVEDLIDDDCQEKDLKVDMKIEKPKPANKPFNLQVHVKEETQNLQTQENACCDYKARYDKLLKQHERMGDQLRTVSRNLELVTRQLVARDGDMVDYMDTVSHLFNLNGKDPGHDLITKMLGLRQKLLKTPNIPAAPSLDLPTSELDDILGTAKPLDCAGAKDRISLLRRSLVPRRTMSRYGYNVALSTRLSQSMTHASLLDSAMFRRSLLRASLPVSVGGHQRSASVSESDSISTASSVASLSEDVGGQGNKKKRSKSLLKQMKRRMSFTNTKGC